jgi:hypothetical protein
MKRVVYSIMLCLLTSGIRAQQPGGAPQPPQAMQQGAVAPQAPAGPVSALPAAAQVQPTPAVIPTVPAAITPIAPAPTGVAAPVIPAAVPTKEVPAVPEVGEQPEAVPAEIAEQAVAAPEVSEAPAPVTVSAQPTEVTPEQPAPVTAAPEVPVVEQPEEKKPTKPVQEGITTLDLDEGNWFLKRQALEKTMNIIEELNSVFTQIMDLRMPFLKTRNEVDREFALFAKDMGFELGDVNQLVTTIVERMEEERTKEGQLNEEERAFLAQLEKRLEELKQLQKDLTAIEDLDTSIDDVIMQVEQEIDQSHSYQAQGWRNFQAIKKVLNDEKAEELALKTEGLLNNIKDIHSYLSGQLMTYFNKKVQILKENMEAVKAKLNTFKGEEGNLKKSLEGFLASERKKEQEREAQEKARIEAAAKKACAAEKPQPSFISRIFSGIVDFFAGLWAMIRGLFGGK